VLEGEAGDLEDGNLGGDALVWSSDLDGEQGNGPSLAVTGLSSGSHIVTLTATDSDGMVGTKSVVILVDEAWPEQSFLPLVNSGL